MEENENRNNKIEMKVKETNQQQVKKKSKVAVVIITVIVVVILVLLCVGNLFDLYLKKGDVFKSSVIKQQEAYELLDELYFSAKSVYKENGFEYEEESETLEITYSNGEKGEANAYQITNYDEIVNNTFTQKGKEQYENKNSLGYKNGKAYGRMVAYAMNITYVETRFVEIDIESDTISCTAENIYSDANDSEDETGRILNSQANFVIKLINGKWLVDEYTYED